jgi:hypothetical protein
LVIDSEVALPALRADATTDPADIVIRFGNVTPGKTEAAGYRRNQLLDQFRYEAVDGRSVTVALLPAADMSNVADLIVSRVLTALLYQRGLLPLHASAVATSGGLVVICGPSGAGKSTLAAVLTQRGHALAADDLLVVGDGFAGSPVAHGLKLSARSLDRIGRTPDGLTLANRVEQKFYLTLDALASAAIPIVRLVQLRDGPPGVTPLSMVAAAAGWSNCIRMPDLMHQAPDTAALWRQWLALVGRVENLAASHGGRMDMLDAIADRIEGSAVISAKGEAYG